SFVAAACTTDWNSRPLTFFGGSPGADGSLPVGLPRLISRFVVSRTTIAACVTRCVSTSSVARITPAAFHRAIGSATLDLLERQLQVMRQARGQPRRHAVLARVHRPVRPHDPG